MDILFFVVGDPTMPLKHILLTQMKGEAPQTRPRSGGLNQDLSSKLGDSDVHMRGGAENLAELENDTTYGDDQMLHHPPLSVVRLRGGGFTNASRIAAGGETASHINRRHTIYGYQGVVCCNDESGTILNEILRMLGRAPSNNFSLKTWPASVRIYLMSDGQKIHPANEEYYEIGFGTMNSLWGKTILPILREDHEGKPFDIFAWSKDQNPNHNLSHIEPPDNATNIIRLRTKLRTAYWKVATNLSEDHGINQLQKGFRGAMQFLRNTDKNSKLEVTWDVMVDGVHLGSPGRELTTELLQHVLRTKGTQRIWDVTFAKPDPQNNIRLIGSHRIMRVGSKSTAYIQKAISNTVQKLCRSSSSESPILSVKIWRSDTDCEDGVEIPLDSSTVSLDKAEFRDAEHHLRKVTSGADIFCTPFRPNWQIIVIHRIIENLDDLRPPTTTWDLSNENPTLENFRKKLSEISLSEQEFFVKELGADDNRLFRITKETTESEWRVNVFNWLHNGNIGVTPVKIPLPYGK